MISEITILGGQGKQGEESRTSPAGTLADRRYRKHRRTDRLRQDDADQRHRDVRRRATRRRDARILINGEPAPQEYRDDPSRNPIALITQHTTFLSDLPVGEFLEIHARVRSRGRQARRRA